MSFGKRRPKLVPGPAPALQPDRPPARTLRPPARPAGAAGRRRRRRPGHRRHRPRRRAAVHLPARPAARPRDPRQRPRVPAAQPDQDQHRAAGRGRQDRPLDGQRPRARSATWPSGSTTWSTPSPRPPGVEALPENLRDAWKLDARDLRRPEDGDRHPRAPRRPAPADREGLRAADPRRRARARHPAPPRGVEPDALRPRARPGPGRAATSSPATGRARAGRQARRAGLPASSSPPSRRPSSARSCSTWSPSKLAGTPTLTYEERYTTQQREQARATRQGRLRHLPTRRRAGRAGPGDHRGATDPAPPGARRRQRPAHRRRQGSAGSAR